MEILWDSTKYLRMVPSRRKVIWIPWAVFRNSGVLKRKGFNDGRKHHRFRESEVHDDHHQCEVAQRIGNMGGNWQAESGIAGATVLCPYLRYQKFATPDVFPGSVSTEISPVTPNPTTCWPLSSLRQTVLLNG
jgi:hypothetical protein